MCPLYVIWRICGCVWLCVQVLLHVYDIYTWCLKLETYVSWKREMTFTVEKISIDIWRFCVLESNIEYCWPFRCSVCVKFWYIELLKHKSGFSCITACLGMYLENPRTKGLHVWFVGCHEYMYVWKSLFLLK